MRDFLLFRSLLMRDSTVHQNFFWDKVNNIKAKTPVNYCLKQYVLKGFQFTIVEQQQNTIFLDQPPVDYDQSKKEPSMFNNIDSLR